MHNGVAQTWVFIYELQQSVIATCNDSSLIKHGTEELHKIDGVVWR